MRHTFVAVPLLAVVSLVGCSQNAELDKARADAAAARAELTKVQAELEVLKAHMTALEAKQKASPANPEAAVTNASRGFFGELASGFRRTAYDSMSLAYQKRTDLKMFEQFIESKRALKEGAMTIPDSGGPAQFRVRKLGKEKAYECDIVTHSQPPVPNQPIQITLRLIEEEGRWKIDDFVEIKGPR